MSDADTDPPGPMTPLAQTLSAAARGIVDRQRALAKGYRRGWTEGRESPPEDELTLEDIGEPDWTPEERADMRARLQARTLVHDPESGCMGCWLCYYDNGTRCRAVPGAGDTGRGRALSFTHTERRSPSWCHG
jgi:hypothetical protein